MAVAPSDNSPRVGRPPRPAREVRQPPAARRLVGFRVNALDDEAKEQSIDDSPDGERPTIRHNIVGVLARYGADASTSKAIRAQRCDERYNVEAAQHRRWSLRGAAHVHIPRSLGAG